MATIQLFSSRNKLGHVDIFYGSCYAHQVENKVCGSDGETYMNECELRVSSCKQRRLVTIASQGPCGKSQSCVFYRDYLLFQMVLGFF